MLQLSEKIEKQLAFHNSLLIVIDESLDQKWKAIRKEEKITRDKWIYVYEWFRNRWTVSTTLHNSILINFLCILFRNYVDGIEIVATFLKNFLLLWKLAINHLNGIIIMKILTLIENWLLDKFLFSLYRIRIQNTNLITCFNKFT